ncbi:MAG: Hsp20/alpha crystallin family protein [Phycisphaerales bacterium]|nr:Hsp20/alpha crystallin family protein [Phycisphaerales bacterium]
MTTRTLFPTVNPTSRVRNEVDRLFDSSVMPTNTMLRTTNFSNLTDTTVPAINLCEDVACLYCEIELPGVPASNIEIQTIGNELIIRGFGILPVPTTATVVHSERGTLRFERTILLPCPVLSNEIVATLNNGVLLVVLPKIDAFTGMNTSWNTGMMNNGLQTMPITNAVYDRNHGIHGLGMNTVARQCPMTHGRTAVPFANAQGFLGQGMLNGMTQGTVQPVMVRVHA